LPDEVTDADLKKAFEPFGHVISARVMMERRQDPTTGKTEFKSKNSASSALATRKRLESYSCCDRRQQILGRNLFVAVAEKNEDRQAKWDKDSIQCLCMECHQCTTAAGSADPHMYFFGYFFTLED
jgi:hypothetical protein